MGSSVRRSVRSSRPGRQAFLAASVLLLVHSCSEPSSPVPLVWSEEQLASILSLSPLPTLPASPSNRHADDERAARLGHELFFDARLSRDGSISCASCHKPALYFSDGQRRAVGMSQVERHTPSLVGAQWSTFLDWDGRKDSLWSQALGPIAGEHEMGSNPLSAARLVRDGYRESYSEVYGELPADLDAILDTAQREADHERWGKLASDQAAKIDRVFANLGKALEAYQRRLLPQPAAFDRFVEELRAGDAKGGGHLSPAALRGLRSFIGDAGCINCHNGPLLSDQAFHNVGLPPLTRRSLPDPGRSRGVELLLADRFRSDGAFGDAPERRPELEYLKLAFEDDLGAFRTPSLRNVARTAPYGHAGQFATLAKLLDFYRSERKHTPLGHLDPLLQRIRPEFDVADMIAFLESLTGDLPDDIWSRAPDLGRGQ